MCCCQLLPAVPRTKDQKITGLSIAKRFKALNMLIIYRKKKESGKCGLIKSQEMKTILFFHLVPAQMEQYSASFTLDDVSTCPANM